MINNSLISVHT